MCTNIFGLITSGDCEAKTETITNELNKEVSKVMIKVMTKQMSTDKVDTQQVQRIYGKTKIGNVDISDVNLEQRSTISLESFQAAQTENEVKTMMAQIAKQIADKTAKTVKDNGGTKTTTESMTNIQNIMENELVTNIGVEQIKNCIASVYQKQEIIAESEVGDVKIAGINMLQTADAIAKCVGKNVTKTLTESETLQEALQSVKEDLTTESKGPFSFLTDIFGNLSTMAIAGGVILVVLMLLAGVGFLIFINMGGAENVSSAVTQVKGQGGFPTAGPTAGFPTPGFASPTPGFASPTPGFATPTAGYATPTAGYSAGYGATPQYSYAPGQMGYGLGKLEPSFWAKLTENTYPVMSRFFDILK
jgi:hypothetical protein